MSSTTQHVSTAQNHKFHTSTSTTTTTATATPKSPTSKVEHHHQEREEVEVHDEDEEIGELELDNPSVYSHYSYQYPYGYPIQPTVSPQTQQLQQEAIYSINVYNLSKSISTKQLSDFIVPIIGGEYYRSSINHIQFFKQQLDDLKSAVVKILGYEVAVRLNNALNGHEFEGNILSSSFGPTLNASPQHPLQISRPPPPSLQQQPSLQFYPIQTTTSPHHRSYSSSTSTGLGSPPALAFPIPLLTPQFEELIDDGDSLDMTPSPTDYGLPYPPVSSSSQHQDPTGLQYNPYQFQYFQPNYSRFGFQYTSPPIQSPPSNPVVMSPPTRHSRTMSSIPSSVATTFAPPMQQQYMSSPPHLPAPMVQSVSASPPHTAYMQLPAPPLPPAPQQQPFYVPQYQGAQSMHMRGGHTRTRSLPVNPYVHPWLLANRFQHLFPQQQRQQQQNRYRHHNRTRAANKYAPILDVSDDDDDDDDNLLLDDSNHTEFSENEHVDRCRLFIGNIPFSTHWQELREFISQNVSGLTRVEIPQQLNGVSKGFAIVFFNDASKALECIKLLDGKQFQGRELTVRYDRHLKYIRKYNNIHAMIKNGIAPNMSSSSINNIDPIKETAEPSDRTLISNTTTLETHEKADHHTNKQEDEVARELMSSLRIK